jgi:nucleoside-diphosphate-sugar epimerase
MVVERIADPLLVTGATGFIGRRLVARLLAEGYVVRALVLPEDTVPASWGEAVEVVRGDVTSPSQVALAAREVGTVFHLAAVVADWGREELFRRVTVDGTENVLGEAARRGARALLASSVVVYGREIGRRVCDEDRRFGRPLGPYSRAKQQQERIARRLEGSHGLRMTIVRPTNVYGAGSGPWVDTVVKQLRAGRPTLVGDGRLNAGLVHVDNVVDLFVRAAERPAAVGRTYNACDDSGVTWLRYFTDLAELAGAPPPKTISRALAEVAARGLEGSYRLLRLRERPALTREALNLVGSHFRVPITKAAHELEFQPTVSYPRGIAEVAAYLGASR